MQNRFDRASSDDMPDLSDVIHEERRRRAGPPMHPWAASYPHALVLARGLIGALTSDDERRDAILADFDSRLGEIESAASGHETLAQQLGGLELALPVSDAGPFDRRSARPSKGPADSDLLVEYESLLTKIQQAWTPRWSPERVEGISAALPGFTAEQAAEAASESKPSGAAYYVLSERHGISPSRVRDRLTTARRSKKASRPDRNR